ncbi:hypothetical protein GWI33_006893 [Rhynchophorus ferrugineus]|uniref:Transposable element Tc3 transposase n=1 Tax=Rhynchophorus ferrugineus TaxID=354439 RepID=A0A834IEC6_RHYFE|nr:hypothetical protein GWI33_006893 [Rhynchophorus ferrugineus]
MIRDILVPVMEEQGLEETRFQQDGATAHTAHSTIQLLNDVFPRRLISRSGDLEWLAKSPDLPAPDFFLWDVMKNALKRAESCIANRGHHLADITFQS